jgi:hypothetical protein
MAPRYDVVWTVSPDLRDHATRAATYRTVIEEPSVQELIALTVLNHWRQIARSVHVQTYSDAD